MGPRLRFVPSVLTALLGMAAVGCTEPEGPELQLAGFIEVTVGTAHSCGLTEGGQAFCWGSDRFSALGDNGNSSSTIPVAVSGGARFVMVSAGATHTCALDAQGQAYCWGNGNSGQLGNGTDATSPVPVRLPTLPAVKTLSSGGSHTCALTASGEAYCWGAGLQGQLGQGTNASSLSPVRVSGATRFVKISAGASHTCALATDSRAFCWGLNNFGQLGNGGVNNVSVPTLVSGGRTWSVIASGAQHSCAIDTDGAGFCWGASEQGELGTRLIEPGVPGSTVPSAVFATFHFTDISAGNTYTCAVAAGGGGWCWGRGLEGQLGTGQIGAWSTPQTVSDGQIRATPLLFARISAAGTTHACGLTTAKAIYCWGRGPEGQLGNPSTSFTALATRVRTQ